MVLVAWAVHLYTHVSWAGMVGRFVGEDETSLLCCVSAEKQIINAFPRVN